MVQAPVTLIQTFKYHSQYLRNLEILMGQTLSYSWWGPMIISLNLWPLADPWLVGPQRSEKCKQFVQSAHIHTKKWLKLAIFSSVQISFSSLIGQLGNKVNYFRKITKWLHVFRTLRTHSTWHGKGIYCDNVQWLTP